MSDMRLLQKAAKLLRQNIFSATQEFHGNFTENSGENSVPPILLSFMQMLLDGPNIRFRFRFKIALLLPIKHRIIYITIKSTWNVNTSTNTAMHYGSKGSWKSCGIYGLLVCYTYSKYISTGVQRVQQKKKVTQNDITSNYVSTTHAVHDFNTVQLK